jgi:hypothetical protein
VIDHEIVSDNGTSLLKLTQTNWADWDSNGDLLYAKDGTIFRLSLKRADKFSSKATKELVDLTEQNFKPVVAPAKARRW